MALYIKETGHKSVPHGKLVQLCLHFPVGNKSPPDASVSPQTLSKRKSYSHNAKQTNK